MSKQLILITAPFNCGYCNPQAKVRFGIAAFPGAKQKLSKKQSTPQRYDGEWITNTLKLIYK